MKLSIQFFAKHSVHRHFKVKIDNCIFAAILALLRIARLEEKPLPDYLSVSFQDSFETTRYLEPIDAFEPY